MGRRATDGSQLASVGGWAAAEVAAGALMGVALGAMMFVLQDEPEAALDPTTATRPATVARGFARHPEGCGHGGTRGRMCLLVCRRAVLRVAGGTEVRSVSPHLSTA